jgi:hypothetical protein
VDDASVGELESAIADLGALVVRVQKYRRGAGAEGAGLFRAAMDLGDAARRLHRHERLDVPAARRLLDDARELRERLLALVADIRASAEYRAAVAAHAAGEPSALAAALPAVFAGLEAVSAPSSLFQAVPWRRRGRLRPVADLAADVLRLRDDGLPAEGDDLSPGADRDLPAVVLEELPPSDEPVAVRVAPAVLDVPVHRLTATGDYLVHTPRLRVPFAVRLAPALAADEAESVTVDYPAYRDALAARLRDAGIPVED